MGEESLKIVKHLSEPPDEEVVLLSAEREGVFNQAVEDMQFVIQDGLKNFVLQERKEREGKALGKFSQMFAFKAGGAKELVETSVAQEKIIQ